jgi:putative DNA primase/helicase
MTNKILPIADLKHNGNSASATSSSGNHATKPRPSRNTADNGSNCRPIGAEASAKTTLPKINAGIADLAAMTRVALKILKTANNPPYLFRHGGLPAWLEYGDDGAPFARTLTEDHLRHELARTMQWGVVKDKKWVSVLPPSHVVKDILATPNLHLPILESIVQTPVFGRDGSLQMAPGYHTASRSYYLPEPGFAAPVIPEKPSPTELAQARNLLLDELTGDFPFVSDPDRAHTIAFSLLFYARQLIKGPTPLHLFEKPTPGTGATLLVDVLSRPATGRPLPAMSEGGDDEECRKRITAMLRNIPAAIHIDNVRRPLDSAALAAAITATVWEDRILGHSRTARLPVRCVWLATANNPVLSNEITRRTIRIRLDAKIERPWLGREFRHPNLMAWVEEHRMELVHAHLVLIQTWIAAGRPKGSTKLGMFECWSEVMGGILEVAGIPGFLGNLPEFYQEADSESDAFREFVDDWWSELKNQSVGVDDLLETAQRRLDLEGGTAQAQRIRLGKLLARNRDRLFGPLRLEKAAKYQGSCQYRLVSIQP